MIVVTGAYGFIGSCLVHFLNQKGHTDIVAVDDFSKTEKEGNLAGAQLSVRVDRADFFNWFEANADKISFVYHLGARTNTAEFDFKVLDALNLDYSKKLFLLCETYEKPLIYASSAATYGDGALGYSDQDPHLSQQLKPLNPYGDSKNLFDIFVQDRVDKNLGRANHILWAGLKFFNVYGPNEYHKGRMASTIFHFFNQIKATGHIKLFRSHRPDYADGAQQRDFIYVKDVLNILWFFFDRQKSVASGLYNVGTGQANPFTTVVSSVFKALNVPENIEFVDIPEDIRDKYQYFTEADLRKLRSQGYDTPFERIEDSIGDYVQNYLAADQFYQHRLK